MEQNKMRKTTEDLSDLVDAEFGGDPDAFLENTDKWLETFRHLCIENERECTEPVAEVRYKQDGYTFVAFKGSDVPVGTELFTFPPAAQVPEGWKLLKDTTMDERSWDEDKNHENGNYFCNCIRCGRQFIGHKRRVVCKSCSTLAAAPEVKQ